jgi:hypothetical protein
MPNGVNGQFVAVEAVQDSVVTDPQAPTRPVAHLGRVLRARICDQSKDRTEDDEEYATGLFV